MGVVVVGCGGDDAPPSRIVTNEHGWPQPQGEWSAIYRVTLDLTSDDGLFEPGKPTTVKAKLVVDQREAAAWSTEGLSVVWVRGHIGGHMQRTLGDVTRTGSWGDLIGIGAQPDTAPTLRAWLAAPGSTGTRRGNNLSSISDGLIFGLIQTPAEAPTSGLTWEHEAAFIPSIDRDEPVKADSTLADMGPDRWRIDSTIRTTPDSTVSGTRSLTISSRSGVVLSGTFEGTLKLPTRPVPAVIHIKGRIEQIDAVALPDHALQVDAAIAALRDREGRVRARAARTLASLFPHAGRAAHILAAAASHDEDDEVRTEAGKALASLGERSAKRMAEFLTDANDPSHHDFRSTARVVMKFGGSAVSDDVAAAIRAAPRAGALVMAIAPLGTNVPGVRGAHSDVAEVLTYESRPLVISGVAIRDNATIETASIATALHALRAMPRWPPRQTPAALIALLKDKDPVIAWAAALTCHCLGSQDSETLDGLRALREAKRGGPSYAAALALHAIDRASKEHVDIDALVKLLPTAEQDAGSLTSKQVHAIDTLGEVGKDAKAALPAIERILAAVYKPGTRPGIRALIAAEALCRIHKPTGERIGLFTVSLRAPSSESIKDDRVRRVLAARAERAAVALGNMIPDLHSKKIRKQIADRTLEALGGFTSADVHRALLRIITQLGADADFAAPALAGRLRQTQRSWHHTLRLDPAAAGGLDRANRTSLLMKFGPAFRREVGLRHGLVQVLGDLSSQTYERTRPTLEELDRETFDVLLRYEIARTLRKFDK